MGIFNNLETLTKLSTIVQWVAISLVFLGGVSQVSKFFIDRQINALKTHIEETKERDRLQKEEAFNTEISGLQETIKDQEGKLKQIDKNVKNRQIPEDEILTLVEKLSVYREEEIIITNVLGDQEAFAFANQIKEIFEKSGWKVKGVNQAVYTNPIKGLIIVIKDRSLEPKAQDIFLAFKNAGFHCNGELNEKQSTGLGIVIGAK